MGIKAMIFPTKFLHINLKFSMENIKMLNQLAKFAKFINKITNKLLNDCGSTDFFSHKLTGTWRIRCNEKRTVSILLPGKSHWMSKVGWPDFVFKRILLKVSKEFRLRFLERRSIFIIQIKERFCALLETQLNYGEMWKLVLKFVIHLLLKENTTLFGT